MRFHEKLLSCLVLWCAVVATNAEPSFCYYCTTDADGTSCDYPINDSGVRVQHCGNSSVTTNVAAFKEIAGTSTAQGTYVCTSLTYTSTRRTFVTIRECQSRLIEGVDICTFLQNEQVTKERTASFSCKACHSDLCNYSKATVHFSTAVFVVIALAKLFV